MNQTICFCFSYSEEDIRQDLLVHQGKSSILARIIDEKREGNCRCHDFHPQRRWCLPDVRRVVDEVSKELNLIV